MTTIRSIGGHPSLTSSDEARANVAHVLTCQRATVTSAQGSRGVLWRGPVVPRALEESEARRVQEGRHLLGQREPRVDAGNLSNAGVSARQVQGDAFLR